MSTTAPWWEGGLAERESLLFTVPATGGPARASLYFPAAAAPSLVSADGATAYAEGRDFAWTPGSRELVLTDASRIPSLTDEQLHPREGRQPRRGGGFVLWHEGCVFHGWQVEATYRHDEPWAGPRPVPAARMLPRTCTILGRGAALSLVVLGDSISAGANASALTGAAPHAPPYADQVAQGLRDRYGSAVALANLSKGGMGAAWGIEQLPAVAAARPDLVVVAFGMNDTGLAAAAFAGLVRRIVDGVRNAAPAAECIVVAPMLGNAEWIHLRPEAFAEFRAGLLVLEGPGVAVADLTALWQELLRRKSFLDLTGNGVNHPNDFGHRLYAQTILALLAQEP